MDGVRLADNRREHNRFLPRDCALYLESTRGASEAQGNRAQGMADLSEGGACATVSQGVKPGEILNATLVLGSREREFQVPVVVRYVKESPQFPDQALVGLEFLYPSAQLQATIWRTGKEVQVRSLRLPRP